MVNQPNIEEIMQQTRSYEFKDGLRDIQIGILILLGGLSTWLIFRPDLWRIFLTLRVETSRWVAMGFLILVVFAPVLVIVGIHFLINNLRKRWLWKDTGIVKQRNVIPLSVNLFSAVVLLLGIITSATLFYYGRIDEASVMRMILVSVGWGTGIILYGLGRATGLERYLWMGVVGGIATTGLVFTELTYGQTALLMGVSWGVALIISGALILRRVVIASRSDDHDG